MVVTSQRQGEVKSVQEMDKVEALRQIIARQEQREVGYGEAQEIGSSLIEFYQLLAEESFDESTN